MKTKVVVEKNDVTQFKMKEMMPGQICVTQESGEYVMRTLREDHFEVMNLSNFVMDGCWGRWAEITVFAAPIGTKIVFEVV